MRPLLALLLSVSILGSLALFFQFQDEAPTAVERVGPESAAGRFDVQITLTFEAGPSAFALSAEDAEAIVVELLGETILRRQDTVPAGSVLRIEDVQGLSVGENSFFVRCVPVDARSDQSLAIRIEVLNEKRTLADKSIWVPGGNIVQGTVRVVIPQAETTEDTDQVESEPSLS